MCSAVPCENERNAKEERVRMCRCTQGRCRCRSAVAGMLPSPGPSQDATSRAIRNAFPTGRAPSVQNGYTPPYPERRERQVRAAVRGREWCSRQEQELKKRWLNATILCCPTPREQRHNLRMMHDPRPSFLVACRCRASAHRPRISPAVQRLPFRLRITRRSAWRRLTPPPRHRNTSSHPAPPRPARAAQARLRHTLNDARASVTRKRR